MKIIPSLNLINQPDALVANGGFRIYFEQNMTAELPPMRVMNYAFGMILTGTATEIIGLRSYVIKPYSVIFTFPGQLVSYTDTSANLSFLYCVFDDDFMTSPHLNRKLIDSFRFFQAEGNPVFDLPVATGQAVYGLLEKIRAECEGQLPDHETLVHLNLLEIFVLINRVYTPDQSGHNQPLKRGQAITRSFKELVSQHFLQKKRVQEYADLLCLTARHLSEIIKLNTGQSPSHWILMMTMLEAKYQLKYSTGTIAEIADHLGYQDAAYFSKVFRKATGVAPQRYRRA